MTHIRVWDWDRCPEKIRERIQNQDDIDYVALVPKEYTGEYIGWLEYGAFGYCCIERIKLQNGGQIVVGYHA